MAEIINTQITANADFSGLLSQVRAAITDLSALQKQFGLTNAALSKNIRTANADFSSILSNSGQFSTQFVAVSKDVEKFGRNLDAGRLKLRDYYRTWQDYHRNSNSMVKELAKQQVALQQAILQPLGRNARGQMQFAVNVPTGIDEIKNKTALANKELSIMNKVMQDGSLQLINWGKNTQWAGRQLTVGLTVPIAAFGKAAADAFRQADQELTRLTKVYGGLSATSSQELQRVRSDVSKAAKEIASGYGVSFKESIALAADIAATGAQGQDLIRSLQETTRLAVLGEVDRQEAMKATLAIQNAFRQNTDQLAESINFLNAVENQTSTTLQDLVEAIPKAGPIIQGLGGSVQDLALYLTAMKEGGVDAASAANGLKSAFGSLINPTKIAKAMFADFGIDLEGIVNKNVGDLTGTIMGLQAALDTLSPLQKQQALEQLFGKYQFARMGALFDNLGRQGSQTLNVLDLMAASTQEIGAIAERELTMVTESASGRYKRAIEGLRADLASVGEGFLDIATKLINVADGVIDFFNKLPDPVKKFLGILGGFTAVTGPIIMLTGVFANFLGYVFKGLSHLRSFFSGAKGFKLLTPDMIAADAAAESFGKTLYSDAAAAQALKSAIDSLRQSIVALNSATPTQVGRVVPGPGRSTAAGVGRSGSIMPGANLAHFIAQARMTPAEFENQTFYHSTPYLGSINQGWGQRPQTIGVAGTPMIEGLTALKGQSTLVDPSQYSRYASMMTVMASKTKQQLDDALMLLQTTGRLPVEFLDEFDDILPSIEKIAINAGNAAKEVATKASRGIITSEQAVLQIEAANRMMLSELESFALARGISPAALRMVPGTNQQIISRARPGAKPTYNMKAAFREDRGGQYTGPLATETGVPLDPSAYQFRNMGGYIYTMQDGNIVPGPNINADVVPAMLTPGEFVVNADATRKNLPLLQEINGMGSNGPLFNDGSNGPVRFQRGHAGERLAPYGISPEDLSTDRMTVRGIDYVARGIPIWMTSSMNQLLKSGNKGMSGVDIFREFAKSLSKGRHPFEPLFEAARVAGMPHTIPKLQSIFEQLMLDLKMGIRGENAGKHAGEWFKAGSNPFENFIESKYISQADPEFIKLFNSFGTAYGQRGSRDSIQSLGEVYIDDDGKMHLFSSSSNPYKDVLPKGLIGSHTGSSFSSNKRRQSRSKAYSRVSGRRINRGISIARIASPRFAWARGVPGFNAGGMVGPVQYFNDGSGEPVTPGRTRGSRTRGSEFSDYQVRGTSPRFRGMPYLPPTIMSQTFSSLVPMAQQYSAAIRMSAEKIIDAYYLAGARYQQAPEVIAKMVQSSTEKINNAYYVAGTRFQQTITNTSAAITKTLTASQVALKNYINSWTIASMRAVPQTWGELLLTRKGLLRPGGQPGSPGLLGRMSNITGMGMGGMTASIAGSTMMMSGMNSGNRMMTAAGTALTFGPMLLGPAANLLKTLKSTGGIAFGLLKTLKSFSIPGLVLTGALMLGKRLLDARNAARELNSAQASTSGIASSDVKGISKGYESLADRIKRAREEQDAYVAAGANAYRSSSQIGIRGLTLSYQELKQAIKAVKESSPELVKDFKTLGESGTQEDITAMATRLKESFLASGMTVQEATNSVYALMKAAGLGKKAVIALGDEGFSSLQTKADVAKSSIQSLVDVTQDPLATSSQSAQALEATASVLSMTGFAVADINNNALKTATINNSIKKAIEQQVPALGKVVQVGDTFAEVLLKAKLLTSGIKLDLSSMSISNLESLAVYSESVSQATTDYINSSGMFTPLTNKVKDLNNAYAKLNSNIQTGQIKAEDQRKQIQKNYEAEKDAIQKKIDLINEEADARLKALDVAKDQADFENELKQATIEYQNAVATGNQTAAASAKLRIEQINRERQYELNRASIEEERESRIKAFQPLLDKIEKTYKAAADKIEKASTTLATQSRMTAPISNQEVSAVQADITSALQRFQLDRNLNAAVTAIKAAMERLPKELRSLVSLPEQFTDEQGRKRVATNLDQRIQGLIQSINSNIGSKAQKIFADKMAATGVTFAEAAKMFKDAAILISGGKLPEDKSAGTRRTNVQPKSQTGSSSLSVPIQELNNSNIPTKQGEVFIGKDGLKYKIIGFNRQEGVAYVARTMAQGGPIFGPGTGTSDSIPAMLSNGEYVVNAKAVSSVGVPFLDSINKMAMGGYINSSSMSNMSVPSYNLGGYVLSPYGNKPFGYMGGSSYSIGSKSVGSNQMTTAVFNFTFESKIHPDDRRALINETITAYKQHTKIENVRMGRSVTYSSNGGI